MIQYTASVRAQLGFVAPHACVGSRGVYESTKPCLPQDRTWNPPLWHPLCPIKSHLHLARHHRCNHAAQVDSEQRPHKVSYHLLPARPAAHQHSQPLPQQEREQAAAGKAATGSAAAAAADAAGEAGGTAWAEGVLSRLEASLAACGLGGVVKVVYSGGVDVDLLPRGAGKGEALAFLLGRLEQAGRWPDRGVQVGGVGRLPTTEAQGPEGTCRG